MTIRPLHWFILLCLALVWGSSYLMIEIALQAWQPAQITGLRILLAAMVLLAWVVFSRSRIPLDLRTWVFFLIIAVIGNCLPFFLISWGQQYVESGLAGILAASTPLVVLILSHFMLPDERLRIRHLVSFMLGFTGVVVLMGADLPMTLGGSGNRLLAQFAIIGGAICYALATVIARRMPPVSPLVTSAGVMLLASGLMTPFIVAAAAPLPEASGPAILALGFLGVMGTGVSSILYFYLINLTGARFTSLLNYLVPAWALLLGVTILGEKFPISTWFALIIILSGLALIARSDDIVPRSEG
ncbi:MAG: DMT family transporter [Gammaproteobacteria bacterium]|nr:DMT family transporter [Gammaproteobacteria bacterium]MDP7661505.1 DMT family transporter [Gammaproteobacteria bacterium]